MRYALKLKSWIVNISRHDFLLPPVKRPSWVEYPQSYRRIVDQKLIDLTPWHILDGKQTLLRIRGLAERYPSRELFPFASRQDNDDVACWARGRGEQVVIIHDFASPGYEDEGEYSDFWSWFRSAIKETISWD